MAEMSSRDAPVTFSTGVNLILVPVVAGAMQRRAIGTLRQEDFRLSDKGKPQVISKLSVEKFSKTGAPVIAVEADPGKEERAADLPAAPPIAGRFVVWLFDDVHINASDLLQARNAADRHLAETLELDTRAAIYTTSGRTTLDFTDDRARLHETLLRIQPSVSASAGMRECPDVSYYQADLIQNKNDVPALQAAEAEFVACNPPPPNKTAAEAMQDAEPVVRGYASRALNTGERDTRLALSVLRDAVRRISSMPGSRSIVLVSPGFQVLNGQRPEETDVMDRAIRANVTISALDARGLYTVVPGGDVSQKTGVSRDATNSKMHYDRESASVGADIMAELADATGGSFFHNNNDFAEGFRRVAAQPEYIYVLGFTPQDLKLDGSFHALRVTLKNETGLGLQARRGYYAPGRATDPEEQAKQDIQEALFSREEMRGMPADLHLQFFKTSDVNARITILARIDVKHLRFRKADGRNNDTLTIVGGVFDRNGNYVSGVQKVIEMRMKDQTLESMPASGITVKSSLDVAPGSYAVRLVVRDSEGQMMSALNGVIEIPRREV